MSDNRIDMMRNSIKIATVTFALVFASSISFAWNDSSKSLVNNNSKPSVALNKAANCSPASTFSQLNLNNVNALIETGGSMWQDRSTNDGAYLVPANSGNSSIYAGALWLAG
ncbi:MAG: hypothetical protein HOK65_06800, partial [Crocinitomicaceae bacterium]|nr:hypothetical protein [Crocinitomicaceae bacterium]